MCIYSRRPDHDQMVERQHCPWGSHKVGTRECSLCSVIGQSIGFSSSLFQTRHWLAMIVADPCPATNNRNSLKSLMWGVVFLSSSSTSWSSSSSNRCNILGTIEKFIYLFIIFFVRFALFPWAKPAYDPSPDGNNTFDLKLATGRHRRTCRNPYIMIFFSTIHT